jgi:CopG family nickel-responsive transcriptional regulator
MQRFTITVDDDLLGMVDQVMARRGYASRSEAMRDLVREAASLELAQDSAQRCMGVLAYVYDYETRALAQRLAQLVHEHHDLQVSGMHVPLNHASGLEVSVLKGSAEAVRALADRITAQRGVRHAKLHIIPVEVSESHHSHDGKDEMHHHVHA